MPPPAHTAPAPKRNPMSEPAYELMATPARLLQRARDVTRHLGGDPASVQPREETRFNYAFFEAVLPDGDYFIKLTKTPGITAAWQERDNALFAAAQGWGPHAIAPEAFPDALLTRLIPSLPLAWHEAAQPDVWPTLLRSIKEVHDSLPARMPEAPTDVTSAARGRLALLRTSDRPKIFDIDALEARIEAIENAFSGRIMPQVFCHRDFHMGNVLSDGTRLWIIDWEYAGWSDPLLEIARFAALAHMSSAQVPALLTAYTGASPRAEDVHYMQLCMAAINIEFLVHNYRLNGLTEMTLRYMRAVVNDAEIMDD